MFARKELIIMKKSYNDMLTLSLLGGGLNNTLVCLKYNNYDTESLRD